MLKPSLALLLCTATVIAASDPSGHTFKKTQLSDKFWSEGATFGDFNHDGKTDIVSGPYWYEGPDFKKRHEYYPSTKTFKHKAADGSEESVEGFEGALGSDNTYSDKFFAYSVDFN